MNRATSGGCLPVAPEAVWCWIGILVVQLSLCHAMASWCVAKEPNLSLTVVPATRHVEQGDPLLVKIVVENRGEEELSIPLPSRSAYSLALLVELKPYTELFDEAREYGDGAEKPVRTSEVRLKPRQRFVTYDRLWRYTDHDAVFRKSGSYKLYAVIRREEHDVVASKPIDVVASKPIEISVDSRAAALQALIDGERSLLSQALNPHRVYLSPAPKGPSESDRRSYAEKIAALEKLRMDIVRDPGTLGYELEWRIELLRLKYGKDDEKAEARRRLDKLRAEGELSEIAQEIITLLVARLDLERGDWMRAQAEIRGLVDSREKRNIIFEIDRQRKKN